MDSDSKIVLLRVVALVFAIGFVLFTRFVEARLPGEKISSWKKFRLGGFVALSGFSFAVYCEWIEFGAILILAGAVFGYFGLMGFIVGSSDR